MVREADMKVDDRDIDDEESGEEDIDEEKKELEQYWKSQSEWVSSAFSQSRDSFLKILQWFLAISTGTLLWFLGNFDKFKITLDNTKTHVEFMPIKELYFFSLFLLILSVIISAYIIVRLYYAQYLSDMALDRFNSCAKEILAKYDLIKTTQNDEYKEKLDVEIIHSLEMSKEPFSYAIESKRTVVEVITNRKTKYGVILSAFFYILGITFGVAYLILFIYRYW